MLVCVQNLLQQPVRIAVTNVQTGEPAEVVVPANGRYGPVAEARLNKYTRSLAAQGRVRIVEYQPPRN